VPTDTPYSIADLARLTDVTPRTVRYYIAQGLLPAPGESGPGAHYGPAHLDRLQLIRRLQRQHLPLAEIRTRLATLSDQEIGEAIRSGEAQRSAQPDSALDYIRTVLGSSLTLPAASRLALPGSARPSMPMAPEPMPGPPASVLAETRSFAVMSVAASGTLVGGLARGVAVTQRPPARRGWSRGPRPWPRG